jgi:mercuric reductase
MEGGSDLMEYRLPVEGMTCADCERHVADALRAAGAIDVVANFRRGEAQFKAPASIDQARLVVDSGNAGPGITRLHAG